MCLSTIFLRKIIKNLPILPLKQSWSHVYTQYVDKHVHNMVEMWICPVEKPGFVL